MYNANKLLVVILRSNSTAAFMDLRTEIFPVVLGGGLVAI